MAVEALPSTSGLGGLTQGELKQRIVENDLRFDISHDGKKKGDAKEVISRMLGIHESGSEDPSLDPGKRRAVEAGPEDGFSVRKARRQSYRV